MKQRGYTALQLIFVFFIVAMIAISIFNSFQKQKLEFKVQRSVMELFVWANTGINFYRAHNRWPDSIDEIIDDGFIPRAQLKSSFWLVEGKDGEKKIATVTIPPGQKNNAYMHIIIQLPELYIANMIASRLPGAFVDESSNSVVVVVPKIMSMAFDNTSLMVKGFYNIENGRVPKPACPKGWQADYEVMLSHWYSSFYQSFEDNEKYPCVMSQQGVRAFKASDDINSDDYWVALQGVASHKPLQITGEGKGCENPTKARIAAITYCRPPALQ